MGGCMPYYSYDEMISSGLFGDYPLFISSPLDPLFIPEYYDPSTGYIPFEYIEKKETVLDLMPPRIRLDLFQVKMPKLNEYILVERFRSIIIGQQKSRYKGIKLMKMK